MQGGREAILSAVTCRPVCASSFLEPPSPHLLNRYLSHPTTALLLKTTLWPPGPPPAHKHPSCVLHSRATERRVPGPGELAAGPFGTACDVLPAHGHGKIYCLHSQLKGNLLILTEKPQVCAKGTWEDSKFQRKWEHDVRKT